MELSKKELYILAGILIAIITAIMSYYFIFLPAQKFAYQQKQDAVKQMTEMLRKMEYKECVKAATEDYKSNWKLNCEDRGKEEDCSLPTSVANDLNKDLLEAQNKTCVVVSENI